MFNAKKILIPCFVFLLMVQTAEAQPQSYDAVHSGVPWLDQHRNTVSAHGAGIIKDKDRYYLFGEFKTDSANVFNGFACYSSADLYNWKFERMALPVQAEGKLGRNRVGERPKVMRSPATGEYVMFMHVDSLNYKDQYVGYATAKYVTGPYTFKGPILFNGKPIRRWDMGVFQDEDGTGYLLVHHGDIYRLTSDYHAIDKQVANRVPGMGESPAMLKKDGVYFLLSSNLTSWERNDNQYHTSRNIAGPWVEKGLFAPQGSLTWNSQCSFVLPIMGTKDTTYMYMGDRWSFPKQNAAATYVWQPLEISGDHLSIPAYLESWTIDLSTGQYKPLQTQRQDVALKDLDPTANFKGKWRANSKETYRSDNKGDRFYYIFSGTGVQLYGQVGPDGGYAQVNVLDKNGHNVLESVVDMYCQYRTSTLQFVSPALPKDTYKLVVTVLGERGNWSDKRKNNYGSTGYGVVLESIAIKP